MAEILKEIKTKIALKVLTYTEWEAQKDTYKPLRGEVCLCEIPEGNNAATNPPTVLFKVGDGQNFFGALNWVSALAADVYNWAKAEKVELVDQKLKFKNADGTYVKDDEGNEVVVDLSGFVTAEELEGVTGKLSELTTGAKTNLVAAINEVRQAVEVGGTGSVVTIAKLATPTEGSQATYQLYQGVDGDGNPTPVGEKIEIPVVPEVNYPEVTFTDGEDVSVAEAATVEVYAEVTASEHALTGKKATVVTEKGVADAIDEYEVFGIDMETVNAVGGIAAGTNLKDKTLHEVLNALLFPYVKPTVGTPTRVPNTTNALEKGNDQVVTSVTAKVTKKSEPITKVELYKGSELIATLEGDNLPNITTSGTNVTFSGLNVEVPSSSVTFTVKATDASGGSTTSAASAGWTFVYPYFYGACAGDKTAATLTEADIEAMTKDIKAKGEKSYTYTTDGQKMVIAYPKAHGALKKALDPNGFDYLGDYDRAELNITGLDGTTQAYYVYAQKAPSYVTSFTMKFQY